VPNITILLRYAPFSSKLSVVAAQSGARLDLYGVVTYGKSFTDEDYIDAGPIQDQFTTHSAPVMAQPLAHASLAQTATGRRLVMSEWI
jgi:hypothetical protein